jgi:hypothetical protein
VTTHTTAPEPPPEPPSEPPTDPVANAEPSDPEKATDDPAKLRTEAANYRRKLRAAEAERDKLAAQVDARDRADVERLAGARMASGADLWATGIELGELRGDDGALAPERVDAAVKKVLGERPHWAKRSGGFDGGARATIPTADPASGFADRLRRLGGT